MKEVPMSRKPSLRRITSVAAALVTMGTLVATGVTADPAARRPAAKSKAAKVKDGRWTGTAVDDKYGTVGAIRFNVRNDGRLVRDLRVSDVAGDCPGPSDPVLGISLPRAKVRPTGLMRGHYVFGKPGQGRQSLVSYDARLGRTSVTNGRIYQNNDLNNLSADQCEVPSVTFTAARRGG
jgi:hypothetical protein